MYVVKNVENKQVLFNMEMVEFIAPFNSAIAGPCYRIYFKHEMDELVLISEEEYNSLVQSPTTHRTGL